MACARCGGLIVKEAVYDREGSSQEVLMDRCLQCGNIEDPVSARNRAQVTLSSSEKGKVRRDPEHPYPPIELAKG
jgi:uncharacterized Zn finger protein